jgi:hypothetical protein
VSNKRASSARGRKSAASAKVSTNRATDPGDVGRWTYLTVGIAAFLAFVVLYGWTAGLPLLVAPLLTGVFVALCLQAPAASALVAGSAGLLAAALSAVVYAMPAFYERAVAAPANTNTDIPNTLYVLAGTLMAGNPLNTLPQPTGAFLLLLFGSVGTGAAAWGCATIVRSYQGDPVRLRRLIAAGLVAVQVFSYGYTAVTASSQMMAAVDQEPVEGTYRFDALIYLKAYYNMLHGQDYYTALVSAAAGDGRVMEEKGIRDGKSYGGWLSGPAVIRRPTIFYVWKYLAPGGGSGIIYLGIVLGMVGLAVTWWGVSPYLSYRAAFVPILVAPYVLFMTLSWNVLFPDFWAALLVACALALIMRRLWWAGALTFVVAAAVRESIGPALAVLAASLVVVWLRSGRGMEWLRRATYFAGGTALWLAFERVHDSLGAPFMAVPPVSSVDLLLALMKTRTFSEKVIRPTQYLVFPYGFYSVPGLGMFLLAPLGFWAMLASRKDVRLAVVAYMVFWTAFLFVVGASSSYWGQIVMLPSLVGLGGLLMSADRMDKRLEMAQPLN